MRLRLIIHVGLNKAGSTSLQNVLLDNKAMLRQQFGIYYETGYGAQGFQNHYDFYKHLNEGDAEAAGGYLQRYVSDAVAASTHTAMISSEDLFFLTGYPVKFGDFMELLRGVEGVDVEFFLILRSFESWARSYLMQLVANGAFCTSEGFAEYEDLATFIANGIRFFEAGGFPMTFADLRLGRKPGGLVNNVMNVLGFVTKFEDRIDNSTGASRYFTAEILTGMTCGLRAKLENLHPNSPAIDVFRTEIQSVINERSSDRAVAEILNIFEQHLRFDINRLIEKSLYRLSTADRDLLVKYGMI
jgi:hypothetical protein